MLRYPLSFDSSKDNWITFKSEGKDNRSSAEIALYMPPAVAFADGASYAALDLGVFGGAAGNVGAALFDGEGGIKGAIESAIGPTENMTGVQKAALSKAFSDFGLGSQLSEQPRDIYLQQKGVAINPNSVLQYTNSEVRAFTFNFKMVAESAQESAVMRDIIQSFRVGMYGAKSGNLTLSYPDKWKIQFHTPNGINRFVPKIFQECYLEQLSANYNTTSNLTHEDGSPTEVDVSLSFKETKALSREDIVGLG